jgi:hypothetical protein
MSNKADANQNEPLQINSEISDTILKDLEELEKVKKRLLEEYDERERKHALHEKKGLFERLISLIKTAWA